MTTMPRLDRRLLAAGLTITVATLVDLFITHRPGQAATCGACGHRYTATDPYCPTLTEVRRLLRHRHAEDHDAFAAIEHEFHGRDKRTLPTPDPTPTTDLPETAELFPVDPGWRREPRSRWAA